MSTQPQLSPLEQLAAMGQPPSQPAQQSDQSPLEQLAAMKAPENLGASPEEKAFLQSNPGHQYLQEDPKFPNRPQGIYPTGQGNEWRKDPTEAQSPIDLHFAKHTAEGAGAGAAAALSPLLLGPAETFAGTAAGKALLNVVSKYAPLGLGLGHDVVHKAAKLLGLVSEKGEK